MGIEPGAAFGEYLPIQLYIYNRRSPIAENLSMTPYPKRHRHPALYDLIMS
jgi:hypothetical protein